MDFFIFQNYRKNGFSGVIFRNVLTCSLIYLRRIHNCIKTTVSRLSETETQSITVDNCNADCVGNFIANPVSSNISPIKHGKTIGLAVTSEW